MNHTPSKPVRVMAIAPSTRGFGFAVLEGLNLVDWGVKSVKGDKNTGALANVDKMLGLYHPDVVVLQDYSRKGCRRSVRIQTLGKQLAALVKSHKVRVTLRSAQQVKKAIFANGGGTKYGAAEIIAKWFPEELGTRMPPKRRPWMSEDYRMGIFDAVALALAFK